MVRRRRAGRFGGDLGIIPLQPGFSPETPIIRISGKVGLLSATQSCTFWWQKLFLRIPPCTFFRKKYQKLSDGCFACSWRPNAGNGRLIAGLQANRPRFLTLVAARFCFRTFRNAERLCASRNHDFDSFYSVLAGFRPAGSHCKNNLILTSGSIPHLRLGVSCKERIYHLLSPKGGAKSVRRAPPSGSDGGSP